MRKVFACVVLLLVCTAAAPAEDFYVSPKGADGNPGTKALPFATLERARDAVRGHTAAVTVWLAGGAYRRTAAFALGKEDGGTAAAPVVYRAEAGARVRLVGGVPVAKFVKWRGAILRADLRAQGLMDFGAMASRGMRRAHVAGMELFFRDEPMTLARWPNVGWAYTGSATVDKAKSEFAYEGERAARWVHAPDAWVHGYWYYDWADHYERVASIDVAKHAIAMDAPEPAYGIRAEQRWQVVNVLEELDEPGEWYVDRAKGVLYFWPPSPMRAGEAEVSLLDGPLVRVEGAQYVEFRDVEFAVARGDGVVMQDASHVKLSHCVVANVGNVGVAIHGGAADVVEDSEVRGTGDGGVVLDGGDRKTLTAAGHVAQRNHIHDYARWSRTYTPAVEVMGVGNRVEGNTIDHAPHFAIWVHGNDHAVVGNDVHTVAMETADASAYYIGADTTERGNVVMSNYFHNLGLGDVNAVYLDDESSGSIVAGNVVRGASRGVKIGGGSDNVVEKNRFLDVGIGIHFDARGMGWQKFFFDGTNPALLDRLKAMPYKDEVWRSHYPQLVHFLDQPPGLPMRNVARGNDCWCGVWVDYRDGLTAKDLDAGENHVYPQNGAWDAGLVKGKGLDIDTVQIARRLVQVSSTQMKLSVGNQGRSVQAGVFVVWVAPGEDGRLVSPGEIRFSLKPGERLERVVRVEHRGAVRVGVYLRGEGFVPNGVVMK